MGLIMAAKERIESEVVKKASSVVRGNSSDCSHQKSVGKSRVNNPTWLFEHNFPAFLSRCKFPRLSEALHELETNRGKKQGLPKTMKRKEDDRETARKTFLGELKTTNSQHRQLGERIGHLVLKVPDKFWEESRHLFQIELLPGVSLEARAHGFTDDGKPVYSRTGRVASSGPFPEDVVRCHAVLQAWGSQLCHLVYANKTYLIEKEDNQWAKDIREAQRCLKENGYAY